MEINKSTVLDIVHNSLSPEQIERSFIYWDRQVRKEGEQIKIGPQTVAMPFDGMVIFVDLAPRFNWAHPCLYLLVNGKDLSTEIVKASFPLYSGEFPEMVTIVLRYGKEPPHGRYFQIFDEYTTGGAS
jgi:hypothetical protein